MSTTDRKQREREAREDLILAVARRMLFESGYHGLNMDRVAEAVEYSKGTIYQHFTTKEDLILAVVLQDDRDRCLLFEQAGLYPGGSRERMSAQIIAHEVFLERRPGCFRIYQMARATSFWEKTSPERQAEAERLNQRLFSYLLSIVHQGIADGDLVLSDLQPDQVLFGLWTMALGAHTLEVDMDIKKGIHVPTTPAYLPRCMNIYLDGLGWKPLRQDLDLASIREWVMREVIAKFAWKDSLQ